MLAANCRRLWPAQVKKLQSVHTNSFMIFVAINSTTHTKGQDTMETTTLTTADNRAMQHIDFSAFGREFIRLVLTPTLFTQKLKASLPASISGETPAVNFGDFSGGKVSYTATNFRAAVGPAGQLGQYNVNLSFRITITVKLVLSRQYVIDVSVPFSLFVQAYEPVVLYINYTLVQPQQMLINCVSSHTDAIDQQIYPKVETQLRELVPQQVNQQLANSYSSRVIDVLKMLQKSSMSLLDAAADEAVVLQLQAAQNRATQVSFEQFGANFMNRVITQELLHKEISRAILTSQNGTNVLRFDGDAEGFHIMYGGHVTCGPMVRVTSTNAYLRFNFGIQIHLDFRIDLPAGTESWIFDITVPVVLDAECWTEADAYLFFRMYPVDPANIVLQSQQTSATGLAWACGHIDQKAKAKVAATINEAFKNNVRKCTRNISQEAAKS